MPGGVGDINGDVGALFEQACQRNRGDAGGGQPPPTTVPPVRPPGLQEGSQWAPPGDHPVQDGDGTETETAGGGGDAGKLGAGVPRLWEADEGGVGVLLPRATANSDG